VLVVCGEGTATAWLLVSRLQTEFPPVEIVDVSSAASLSEKRIQELGACAVVSRVAITSSPVPVIQVRPLLDAQDSVNIKGGLAQTSVPALPPSRPWNLSGHPLSDLLCEDTIALQVATSDWEGVVEAAGNLLSAAGAIELPYVQARKDLIHDHGPYVVIMPGVALLHAHPGEWVRRICWSLVTLREPVPFGHPRHDPVRLAVALNTTDGRSHWRALRQLVDVLNDSSALEQITSTCSREEVLWVLTREEPGAEH